MSQRQGCQVGHP